MEETYSIAQKALDWAWNYGPNILISIAILIGGLWAIKKVMVTFNNLLTARKVDESLRPFFASVIEVGLKVALLLIVAGRLGFETTSFIAIISALAFAVGLALQGSLGNFASGVLILLFRPYKVGDLITVAGLTGTVREIQIFNTILATPNGKKIIIPNGSVTGAPIENVPSDAPVRVEIKVQLEADTSPALVKAVMAEVATRNDKILKDRPPHVGMIGFPGANVEYELGVWTTGEHYSDMTYFLNEEFKKAADATGIQMADDDPKFVMSNG